MRPTVIMALVGTLGVLGCGEMNYAAMLPDEETTDPIPAEPSTTPACGYCVDTAPATFTGPSNFFRGKFEVAPDCEDPTPLQGIEGFLTEPSPFVDFVRECRITPTDSCKTEGKVCAPIPEEGYFTCVHHTGQVACEAPYSFRDEVAVLGGGLSFTITLCCTPGPEPA